MKTALIIGGSHGIGCGIVEAMAKSNYKVIFTYHKHKDEALSLEQHLKESSYCADAVYGNFDNAISINSFLANIGDVDVLVNNAAINQKASFIDYSYSDFIEIMSFNLYMPFLFCQAMARKWVSNNTKGKIINITSIRGSTPQFKRVGYCCSKSALNMLTKCAAYELAQYGITVNAIAIGLTKLGMNENVSQNYPEEFFKRVRQIPLGRTGSLNDIGEVVSFLASCRSDWITGQIFTVDGGHSLVTF